MTIGLPFIFRRREGIGSGSRWVVSATVPPLVLGVVLALAYGPTRLVQEANPEWRLVSWALAIEVIGLTILALHFIFQSLRASSFPLPSFSVFPFLFFLVAVPWPTLIEGPVIRNLTNATVQGTAEILGLFGIPAVLHGNVIETGAGLLGIDDACSGIRSFQASLMLAIFFGEAFKLSFKPRLLCIIGGLLFALGFNLVRTTFLALVIATKGSKGLAAWHDSAGLFMPLCCFAAIWLFACCLRRMQNCFESIPTNQRPVPVSGESVDSRTALPHLAASLAFVCWIAFVEIGTEMWYSAHEQGLASHVQWRLKPPTGQAGFCILELSESSRQLLRFDYGLNTGWQDSTGWRWQALFLRWEPGHVALRLARNHTPEDCLTAAGHELVADPALHLMPVQGLDLPFRFYSANNQSDPFHVFYCLWEDRAPRQSFSAEWMTYRSRFSSVLNGRRNSGQRSLELALWGPLDDAQAETALKALLPNIIEAEN